MVALVARPQNRTGKVVDVPLWVQAAYSGLGLRPVITRGCLGYTGPDSHAAYETRRVESQGDDFLYVLTVLLLPLGGKVERPEPSEGQDTV